MAIYLPMSAISSMRRTRREILPYLISMCPPLFFSTAPQLAAASHLPHHVQSYRNNARHYRGRGPPGRKVRYRLSRTDRTTFAQNDKSRRRTCSLTMPSEKNIIKSKSGAIFVLHKFGRSFINCGPVSHVLKR